MSEDQPGASEMRLRALSRWDNEGGASVLGQQEGMAPGDAEPETPGLTQAEIIQLRVRVIALENLLITLLAEGSERQRDLSREMAAYISPRPGFTHHPLTIRAAAHMNDLVDRARHFQSSHDPVGSSSGMELADVHLTDGASVPRAAP